MTLLYSAPEVGDASGLTPLLNSSALVRGGRGRTSVAYRLEGAALVPLVSERSASSMDMKAHMFCVKRVTIEDQVRPHDVMLELRLLARMEHPNVPRLLAATEAQDDILTTNVSLLMRWYDVELAAILDDAWFVPSSLSVPAGLGDKPGDGGPPGQEEKYVDFAQLIGQQIFTGLAYLHDELHIAHRDIKPSNLMLAFEAGSKDVHRATLKIIDFGTAVEWTGAPGQEESARCQTAQVGTGSFRAPELLFAPTDGYDSRKIDIWAAACVLAMLYTGFKRLEMPALPRWAEDSDSEDDWRNEGPSLGPPPVSLPGPPGGLFGQGLPPWMKTPKKRDPVFGERVQRLDLFPTEVASDIPLAGSIFSLKGLPSAVEDWPEGATFQPPLDRLPFKRGEPHPILDRLPVARALRGNPRVSQQVDIIARCTRLSARRRPTAKEAGGIFFGEVTAQTLELTR